MKEEREKSTEEHEEEEKDTFEIFFLQEGPFYFFFWIANYFLKEAKEQVCLPVLSASGFAIPYLYQIPGPLVVNFEQKILKP